MKSINVTSARNEIFQLIKEVRESHDPIMITSKGGNAFLISDEDWSAIQETLYLLGIPGMREKIVDGMKSNLEDSVGEDELNW